MRQVFRIEHRTTKVGPFQTPHDFTQALAHRAGLSQDLPNPRDDGFDFVHLPWCWVFGSPSVATLKRWFFLGTCLAENDQIVRSLKALGFHLAEYLVEDEELQEGWHGNQVAFDAIHCRLEGLVEYHDLETLLTESPLVFCCFRPGQGEVDPLPFPETQPLKLAA